MHMCYLFLFLFRNTARYLRGVDRKDSLRKDDDTADCRDSERRQKRNRNRWQKEKKGRLSDKNTQLKPKTVGESKENKKPNSNKFVSLHNQSQRISREDKSEKRRNNSKVVGKIRRKEGSLSSHIQWQIYP